METPIQENSLIKASNDLVFSNVDDEVVILNTKNGVYYSLNDVGGFIWEVLQEPRRLAAIVDRVVEEYDVEYQRCREDVLGIVQQMIAEGIAEISDDKNR